MVGRGTEGLKWLTCHQLSKTKPAGSWTNSPRARPGRISSTASTFGSQSKPGFGTRTRAVSNPWPRSAARSGYPNDRRLDPERDAGAAGRPRLRRAELAALRARAGGSDHAKDGAARA